MLERKNRKLRIVRCVYSWWREGVRESGWLPTLGRFLSEAWTVLRDSTPERRRSRYGDAEYDWENRVDTTSGTIGFRERVLGTFSSPYQPTDPELFREMLAALKLDFRQFTFVDLGSGKGRTLMMAAEYPFRRIVGVELIPELHRIAEANLKRLPLAGRQCSSFECLCMDASGYVFPPEPAVVYLFNPFPEGVFERVMANLGRSLAELPRELYIVYHNPLLERVVARSEAFRKIGGTHQYVVYKAKG